MYKNSHRALGVALAPLLFINTGIEKWDSFIHNQFSSEIDILKYILFWIVYMVGTTVPDFDLKLKHIYPSSMKNQRFRYHRQITHSVLLSISLLAFSVFYYESAYWMLLAALALGIITHQIGDMLTGSIPWFFYGPYFLRFSRIGITTFLPRNFHEVFTVNFSKWANRNLIIFIFIFFLNLTYILINLGQIKI